MESLDSLIDLYTTLFVLVITALGALMASIIALTQLLERFLVSKSARNIVYSQVLMAAFLLIALAGAISLVPMVLLSMESHNFLPWVNLGIDQIFAGHVYVALAVSLFLIATTGVIAFIYQASQYLIPANAIAFLKDSQKDESVASFFQIKSTTKPVHPIRFSFLLDEEAEGSVSDEAKEAKYSKDLKKYEKDKTKLEKMENPLFPLEAYLTHSIRDGNITITRKALRALEECIVSNVADTKFHGAYALIYYYKTVLQNADELARSIGLRSVSQELLESSSRVSEELITNKRYAEVNILFEYWQSLTGEMLGKDSPLFRQGVGIIGSTGRTLLKTKEASWEQIRDIVDNISRTLGWLGENLLKQPPERRALMINSNYSTEFDEIMNAVLEVGWGIRNDRPETYPLIHFDSIFVIANKLAPYVTDDEYNNDDGNSLFSLAYDMYSCGESAVEANNMRGACLALLRLEQQCKIAEENGLRRYKQNILDAILRLGALAAGKELEGIADFLVTRGVSNLSEASIESLKKHAEGYDLSSEAHEVTVKLAVGGDNYDKVKQYLSKAGHALGTDFGINLALTPTK